MRVGTKLTLLVVIPTCGLVVFASLSAIDHWREADRLREFRTDTRLSVAVAGVAEAVANERSAVVAGRLGVRSAARRRIAAARRAVDAGLRRAAALAPGERAPVDVADRLDTARRGLDALRKQAAGGSLGLNEIVEEYGGIVRGLVGIVRDLDSARPSRDRLS